MRRVLRTVVSYGRILSKRHAYRYYLEAMLALRENPSKDWYRRYLLRQLIHVLSDKLVTGRMEKGRKAPRISKCYKMRLAGIKVNIKHS